MLALMHNGEHQQIVREGARLTLPNGDVVSPAIAGWSHGDFSLVPYLHPPPPEPDPAEVLSTERAGMVCSRFQAKAALLVADLMPQVEAAIADADDMTQLAWAEAVEFKRNSPTIVTLAAVLGLTDGQVDDLFRAAMQIEA